MELLLEEAYDYFDKAGLADKLVIQTYFERANVKFLSSLPVGGLGLDFVHDNGYNLKQIESGDFDSSKTLYAGIIDGRNVWAADIELRKINRNVTRTRKTYRYPTFIIFITRSSIIR